MQYTSLLRGDRAAAAGLLAALAMLCGALALLGWWLNVAALKSLLPGAVAMKANTAVAILLCGMSLAAFTHPRAAWLQRLAVMAGAFAACIGLATLTEYVFGLSLGIDELLFRDDTGTYNAFRGRMSPYSAAVISAVGSGLVVQPYTSALPRHASQAGALLALVVGAGSLLGYALNARELVTDDWLPPVALNTAAAFVLLGGGMLLIGQGGDRRARRLSITAVEAKLLAGFIVAPCLVLLGGGFTYLTSVKYTDTVEWVNHVQELRSALTDLYTGLSAAELAERDYLFTSNPQRRDEYAREFRAMDARLDAIAALLGEDAGQRDNLVQLRDLLKIRRARLDGILAAFDSSGMDGVRQAIVAGRNLPTLREVHALTQRMDAIEAARLAARAGAPARVRTTALVSLLATLIMASATFVFLFRAVHREMGARETAERALRASHAELESNAHELLASNQDLESFSFSVSHDLRAPLRAIDGFVVMLEEDYAALLDAEGRRYIGVIRDNSHRMATLIDDLLAFSRLGCKPVAKQDIDMEALVHEAFDEALSAQPGSSPTIRIGSLPGTRADPTLLRQVWLNLISNALKYGSKARHPTIEVSAKDSNAETIYCIRDNGVGFPMDCRDKLFGIFQRLHRDHEFSGTGVGLAIVQRVVSRHGGRVWAEGKVGEGASFSFALPREAPLGMVG
jgi:signal transduction histidine kinase